MRTGGCPGSGLRAGEYWRRGCAKAIDGTEKQNIKAKTTEYVLPDGKTTKRLFIGYV